MTIKEIYKKYKEQILYIIFGGLTTVINFFTYLCCTRILFLDEMISSVIGFILSVLFAYVTNRKFVFESKKKGIKNIFLEMCSFYLARLFSGGVDLLIVFIFVTILNQNDIIVKIISNIIVIVLNFILSKLLVFRKKG